MLDKTQQEWLACLAFVYIQQRHYTQALVLLEALDTLQPENPDTLKALSLAYLNMGYAKKALHCIDLMLEKDLLGAGDDDSRIAPLLLMKSQALWKLGQTEPSRACMQRYIAASEPIDDDTMAIEDHLDSTDQQGKP